MHMNVLSGSIIISDNDDEFVIYGNETDSHKIEILRCHLKSNQY